MSTLPTALSGLLFWYKADAITGHTNGQSVTSWPDSGPNGWNIATVAGTAPTYVSSALNGLPGVAFSGGTLKLPTAALGAFTNRVGATLYVVFETTGTTVQYPFYAADGDGTDHSRLTLSHNSGSGTSRTSSVFARRLDAQSSVQVTNPVLHTDGTYAIESVYADWANNALGIRNNGGTWTVNSAAWSAGGNSDTTNSTEIQLGGQSSVPSYMTGTIVEVFAFSRVLTSTEQAEMDSYLSDRYGISVANYYTPPTVPGAPTGASATGANAQATVTFTAPTSDGGATITGYTATSTPGSKTGSVTGANAAPITVTGLTNGTSYTFTVHATNSVGNSAESAPSNAVTPAGTAPVANAGPDQTNLAGTTFTLDGSASTGSGLKYAWAHTSGPYAGTLSDPTAVKPFYTPQGVGTDVWTLTVTDSSGLTSSDTVSITATDRPPVAAAGPDQIVVLGATVTLDGSGSYDPDLGSTITYYWKHISGPNLGLSSHTAIQPAYPASTLGTDVWQLTVTDSLGSSSSDTVSVQVVAASAQIRQGGVWVPGGAAMRSGGVWVGI